jgi:hypothetical protein
MEVGGKGCLSRPPTGNGWCIVSRSGEDGGCSRLLGGGSDSGVPGPGRLPLEHTDDEEQLDEDERLLRAGVLSPGEGADST